MRMRRKPWTEIELANCPFLIDLPSTHIGQWRGFFRKDQPVHLEIGCGKGVATAKMARENPGINYIAIDEVRHVLAVSVRNVRAAYGDDPIDNIVFSAVDAMMIHDTFNADDGIGRIYISFPNPWDERAKHHKRRLTHPRQLLQYKAFMQPGGEIWFNTEVTNILTDESGHVRGIRLKDGREIASRHVIANCSPHMVYGRMMDPKAVPERARKLTNFRKFAGRGFTVFLGLNKTAEELGLRDHNYFVYDTCDNMRQYASMKELFNSAAQATVCLNNADPDCSPEGTCIVYMTTLFTDDAWSSVKEEDYFKTKNRIASAMIRRFEEAVGVNLRDHIEEIAVATPQTYARYCGHPQGVIYGYESQYYDGLMTRIQMVEEDRFVPGLRIGGAFGERLIGYPSSYKSGANEAGRTLRDMAKEGD